MAIEVPNDQGSKVPPFCYTNTRKLLNSNIQYQFLKYNGFKLMKTPPNYLVQDKIEYLPGPSSCAIDPLIPQQGLYTSR